MMQVLKMARLTMMLLVAWGYLALAAHANSMGVIKPIIREPQTPHLSISHQKLEEGSLSKVSIHLRNMDVSVIKNLPLKGWLTYSDQSYDLSTSMIRKIPFTIGRTGMAVVSTVFQTAGTKSLNLRLEDPAIPARNETVQIDPFKATIFPRSVDTTKLSRDPKDWQVWANLAYGSDQRQYYQITHRGEIIQRFLTSGGKEGHVTPLGQFQLGQKLPSPRSSIYGDILPFWITVIIPGHNVGLYGTHGLEEEEYLLSLGAPASHGCLRLSNKPPIRNVKGGAQWVYENVPSGTKITIFKQDLSRFVYEDYDRYLIAMGLIPRQENTPISTEQGNRFQQPVLLPPEKNIQTAQAPFLKKFFQ